MRFVFAIWKICASMKKIIQGLRTEETSLEEAMDLFASIRDNMNKSLDEGELTMDFHEQLQSALDSYALTSETLFGNMETSKVAHNTPSSNITPTSSATFNTAFIPKPKAPTIKKKVKATSTRRKASTSENS